MNDYYEHARTELLSVFPRAPRHLLDVGCASGSTSAHAKRLWPSVKTTGIEVASEPARQAKEKLAHVVHVSVESIDFAAEGIANVDAVLEHLVEPWVFLARLREILDLDAVIVASIPNAANLWLIEELAAGRFDYASDGLLDRTHLRFFTRSTIAEMFSQSGYRIDAWRRITDGRVDDLTAHRVLGVMLPARAFGRLRGRRVTIDRVGTESHEDLRTIQFVVQASLARR